MDGAHWPHMEFPHVFNAIMGEWLAGVGLKDQVREKVSGPQPEGGKGNRIVNDEL